MLGMDYHKTTCKVHIYIFYLMKKKEKYKRIWQIQIVIFYIFWNIIIFELDGKTIII